MRSTSITLIYIGYSVGQIGAGIVGQAFFDEPFGWQAVVAFGGVVTLIFAATVRCSRCRNRSNI